MKKLIAFDLFGVVIDSHSQTKYNINNARQDIADFCNFDKEIFLQFFNDVRFGITLGKEFENLIQEYINKCNSNVTTEQFIEIYKESYGKISCYENVIKFINELQDKKICETAILSKLCVLDKIYIEKHLKLEKFDNVFFSCDLGMEKPHIEAYQYVEKISEHRNCDILFIDDNLKNIEVAKSLGWNTCHATGDELDKIMTKCKIFLEK